jgi:glycine hydroxymethyltransferase
MILSDEEYIKPLNSSVFPGTQGGPLMHVIAGKAVAFGEALRPEFKQYAAQIRRNAKTLAVSLHDCGVTLISGGTENHLMLADLTGFNITGAQAQKALDRAGITVNKNAIPDDPQPPVRTSGIRIGTPAVTSRGMKEPEMQQIAGWIVQVLENIEDQVLQAQIATEVKELCAGFPVPADLVRV